MIQKALKAMILRETSVTMLAASFAVGAYVAFSPYIFLHTVLAFLLAWLFSLNFFVIFAASNLINNPWTMIPVYSSGYYLGEWFLQKIYGIDTQTYNPIWVQSLNDTLYSYTGLQGVSFWSFMLGGNLLGIIVAGILYPVMKPIFARLIKQVPNES